MDFVGVAGVAKVYIVGVFEDFVGVARMAKVHFVGVFMDFVGVALRGWRQKVTRNRSSFCQKSALPSYKPTTQLILPTLRPRSLF